MPKITSNELLYKYSRSATDDTASDAKRSRFFSAHKEHEVADYLNTFTASDGSELTARRRQVIEWMLNEHLPATHQAPDHARKWVFVNYPRLRNYFPK